MPHYKIVNFELSFLKRTMNTGKINSNALKVRLGIKITSSVSCDSSTGSCRPFPNPSGL
ncbi:hypothetical protein Goklo_020424, partial [Gossypium klotzschianum]|nr:hypothetical protein [Gossypium klotzschianum]